jgi:predicted ATP-dependent endonuclease of OLD family
MHIKRIQINNFRLLKDVHLSLETESTVIVGRNNSGKTSLTELFRRFINDDTKFKLEDFSLNSISMFQDALQAKLDGREESEIRSLLPSIDLTLTFEYADNINEYGALSEFIIDLDETKTEAIIKLSYQLKSGRIDALFDGCSMGNLFETLKLRLSSLFSTVIYSIDPTNDENITIIDNSIKLHNLLKIDFINAQRGLDDVTQSEKDILGKVLSNIFKSASSIDAPQDMKEISQKIEKSIDDLQSSVNNDLKGKINKLLPMLSLFGYPGLSDPNISAEPIVDIKTILESNTKIKYQQNNGISLPETYNGLGSRNLIYIMFKLYEFFRNYQSDTPNVANHIIFIEEPEAHLHPQMQEIFIRKISEVANKFAENLNGGQKWPVQFVVTTHSTHIANEASFESIRYFSAKSDVENFYATQIKDLHVEFDIEENKEDKEFIHKYLTLTKCDLFFADKAIFFEGPTERILLPEFIGKTDSTKKTNLSTQYISSIEIGGAYAHHFYKFIDFLELKALVITDLDSTRLENSRYQAYPVNQSTHTSNIGLKQWFNTNNDNNPIDEIISKTEQDKITKYRRIAFEIPENDDTACGRSFEDSFIIANKEMFEFNDKHNRDLENAAFSKAQDYVKSKANFALELALSPILWKVPRYIEEGLIWLSKNEEDKI